MALNEHKQPFWDSSSECYDRLADYYDILRDIVQLPAPRFYQDLITDRTRSVLELGCGTGIITMALADRLLEQHASLAGVRVVGIDASAEMLRIAAARDNRIDWIKGDMREPPVEGRFDLVVCCYHTLQYMLNEEDMICVFNAVQSLLQPRGVFAFDIYQPNFDYLNIPRTDDLIRSTVDAEGRTLELREDTSYDHASRVLRIDCRLLHKQLRGSVILTRMRQYARQYTAADVDRLLKRAGLTALARFGDVERSPFTAQSKDQVVICGRCSEAVA
jgi:Methylase involved in ubiquinone/menaquinone biosynthesis